MYLLSINFKKIKSTKEKLLKFLKKNKILAQYHYIPIYKFKIYNKKFYYPNAELYFKNTISLPIFYNYSYKKSSFVASVINDFFIKNFR